MIRDRYLLWLIIVALGLLILAQAVGQGMINHWNAQGDKYSQPDPAAVKLLAHN